jgi:hypothetical protein
LALVTVLQMAENLTDRQAADAVRDTMSWKYALGLGLDDEGFDASVFWAFRRRVVAAGLSCGHWTCCWARWSSGDWSLPVAGRVPTPRMSVCTVRDLNRLELAGESVPAAVEALVAAPDPPGAAPGLSPPGAPHLRPRPALLARSAAGAHHRVIETRTGRAWATIHEDLRDLHVGDFTGSAGTFTQTSEPTTAIKAVLAALDLTPPKKVLQIDPAT